MSVRELIEKLKELPEDCDIYFRDYNKTYDNAEVTGEYMDEPYIYLS